MPIGLDLSRGFFTTLVAPIIAEFLPTLRYGAGRLGDGSEVIGFDTDMSADHNYGPTVQIFLAPEDFDRADALMEILDRELPQQFEGWLVRYPSVGRHVRADGWLTSDHGVEVMTLEALVERQLGTGLGPYSSLDWLAFPQQRLLTLTEGAVFRDDGGSLNRLRSRLAYFPRDVWLSRLAAQWDRIGEERAFVGRTGLVDDDLGSRLIASRLVENLMQLAFLIERRYAPYAKWFGSAFLRLKVAAELQPLLAEALGAPGWQGREAAIAAAAEHLARLQLEREVPGAIAPRVGQYFTRPFRVINADEIAAGLRTAIEDDSLRARALGAIDQVTDLTPVLTQPHRSKAIATTLNSLEAITAADPGDQ